MRSCRLLRLFGWGSLCTLLAFGSCSQSRTPKSAEDIWKDSSNSIVYVTAESIDGKTAQGSGFVANLEGKLWVVTNRHVVRGAERVTVAPQGKNPRRASFYKISPDLDLAIIECPANLNVQPLPLAKQKIIPGADIYVLGFPLGLANVISRGIIGATEDDYFLFDAPISSGNSGGPVVNNRGEVVGVATMGSRSTEGAIAQNLNVGIRVAAIPRLQLFADPLLRISSVSDRIRETEKFIEEGFLQEDLLALAELLQFDYFREIFQVERSSETDEWKYKLAQNEEKRRVWQSKHGAVIEGVKRWVQFLKKCEVRIDAIPAAFAGLGNDPLLAEFLKDERSFKLSDQINATPETLPALARIGADHWLARFEDLRYHLEFLIRYSKLPSDKELDLSGFSEAERQRPSIRLKFAITGNRQTDLEQYRKSLLSWSSRKEVFDDTQARILHGTAKTYSVDPKFVKNPPAATNPIESERLHGVFLKQVSSMWAYLAAAAADRGNLEEAVRMLQRDLKNRPRSHYSGGILGVYFVAQGKFDDAWRAYREHLICEPPFDAFELQQRWSGMSYNTSHFLSDLVEGIDLSVEFKNLPEILRHVDEWNEQVTRVGGREFKTLGSMSDTLSSGWFKELDDLDKLRALYYYRVTRPHDEEIESYSRTGKVRDPDTLVRQEEEFAAALHTAPDAEGIWARATADHHLDPPL